MIKKKYQFGLLLGSIAVIIDVIPMVIQKLTWDANISAFSMWVVIGFLISISKLNVKPIFQGIIISFSVLLPSAILIGWKEPMSLLPIFIMTLIISSLLGHSIYTLAIKMKLN